ncbi:uncharacterized protein LOC141964387 isoform X2 [Athene noctua]|uniref:uncharacterized protein LOC141964387 isoform X2 n=1 Tax=Athene noctua TaxID=126797 RepID=UPI003EBD5FFD
MPGRVWRPGCPGMELEESVSPGAPEGQAGYRQGQDAGLGQPMRMKPGVETHGGLGGGRRGGQPPGSASSSGPPLGGGDAPSRAPVRRCPRTDRHHAPPRLGPVMRGRRELRPGALRPLAGGAPGQEEPPGASARAPGLRGGDWCRQRVRPPRSARAGSRACGGEKGGRGGPGGRALSAAAPPPVPGGRPAGRLSSALARERGARAPPAPTYRPPPDPHPPLRYDRRSNMAARGAAGNAAHFRFRPLAAARGHAHKHARDRPRPPAARPRPPPRPPPRRVPGARGNGAREPVAGGAPRSSPGPPGGAARRKRRGRKRRRFQLLEWPGRPHDVFSVQEEPSKRYHLILPAFFRLLDTLHRDGRAFAVIFRTFGTDLPRALRAVSCALAGQHPQFPTLRDVALPVDLTPGQIRCGKREVVLTRGAERLATWEDGRKLYDYFSSFEGIGGFQDHFEWVGSPCGLTPTIMAFTTSSLMTTSGWTMRTPLFIPRCFRSRAAAAPGAFPPRSCMTFAWCRPTCWRPLLTRTISCAA